MDRETVFELLKITGGHKPLLEKFHRFGWGHHLTEQQGRVEHQKDPAYQLLLFPKSTSLTNAWHHYATWRPKTARPETLRALEALVTAFSQVAAVRIMATTVSDLSLRVDHIEQAVFAAPVTLPMVDWASVQSVVVSAGERLGWSVNWEFMKEQRTIIGRVPAVEDEKVADTTFDFYKILSDGLGSGVVRQLNVEFADEED